MHTISSILSSIISLAVLWFIWSAIFSLSANETIQGFTFNSMITYVSISIMASFTISSWVDFFIEEDVKTGKISNMLTKPFNYVIFRLSDEIGRILFKALTRIVPLVLVSFVI